MCSPVCDPNKDLLTAIIPKWTDKSSHFQFGFIFSVFLVIRRGGSCDKYKMQSEKSHWPKYVITYLQLEEVINDNCRLLIFLIRKYILKQKIQIENSKLAFLFFVPDNDQMYSAVRSIYIFYLSKTTTL